MKKVALITGSSRGMGKAEAFEFASCGYDVIVHYVKNKDKAEEVRKGILGKYPVDVLVVQADLSKEEDIRRLVKTSYDRFHHIDALVNNAGIAPYGPISGKTITGF